MTHTKKPSPDTGKVSTFRLTEGASVSRNERIKICMSKNKKIKKWIMRKSCPRLTGKVAAIAVGRGKYEQEGKRVSYKTVLNTCPSFLNEVKNLAKDIGFTYFSLCTHTRPYRLAKLGTSPEGGGS